MMEDRDYADVTMACEDGRQGVTHKTKEQWNQKNLSNQDIFKNENMPNV